MTATTPDDEVTVSAGSKLVSGWQTVSITCGMESCPNSFSVGYTEKDGVGETTIVEPGQACTIQIGSDTVITGYADAVEASFSATQHELRLSGRGKCEDLVDCTAEWPTATIASTDVLDVATKLAKPYGITVSLGPDTQLATPQLPAFNITLTESAFALIEEMARFYQVLAYEDSSGNLLLSSVGKTQHASGFAEGINVTAAHVTGAMDERFSEYFGYITSTQVYGDLGTGANLLASQMDPAVTRHRRRALVVEAPSGFQDVGVRRVAWERTRRAGRGLRAMVTVDNWRDSAGKLWTPNNLAQLELPSLHIDKVTWIIGQVTFLRDQEQGTRAEVLLMAPEAYTPEPILLQTVYPDIQPVSGAQ